MPSREVLHAMSIIGFCAIRDSNTIRYPHGIAQSLFLSPWNSHEFICMYSNTCKCKRVLHSWRRASGEKRAKEMLKCKCSDNKVYESRGLKRMTPSRSLLLYNCRASSKCNFYEQLLSVEAFSVEGDWPAIRSINRFNKENRKEEIAVESNWAGDSSSSTNGKIQLANYTSTRWTSASLSI